MGEWSASSITIDMEQVIAESQLVSIDSSDPYGDDSLSWKERFFTGVTTEAKEIFEGAKNFAKNAMQRDKQQSFDPKRVHELFDEIYGWADMTYELQLYDVDYNQLSKLRPDVQRGDSLSNDHKFKSQF